HIHRCLSKRGGPLSPLQQPASVQQPKQRRSVRERERQREREREGEKRSEVQSRRHCRFSLTSLSGRVCVFLRVCEQGDREKERRALGGDFFPLLPISSSPITTPSSLPPSSPYSSFFSFSLYFSPSWFPTWMRGSAATVGCSEHCLCLWATEPGTKQPENQNRIFWGNGRPFSACGGNSCPLEASTQVPHAL
ncbi:hypothetical protein AAFF_G00397430, partial [Aldrovandia affinis]